MPAIASLLCACSDGKPAPATADLETSAIARGLVRNVATASIDGIYAREGDRICVASTGSGVRIGAFVDFGDGIGCSASGPAAHSGERLSVEWPNGCRFEAGFDGTRISLPGSLPAACAASCTGEASFAGLTAERLSESAAEAVTLRDMRGRRLCQVS